MNPLNGEDAPLFLATSPFSGFLPNVTEGGRNDDVFPMRGLYGT